MNVEFPDKRELVICKVKKIFPYGAIVFLEEYPGVEGFVPLSQVSSKWVKNIRNFIKVGQIKVGRVSYVQRDKNQVNVSFANVSENDEKQKLSEWRQTKRVQQLLGLLAKKYNKDPDALWDEIVDPILETYNSVFDAFKDIILNGPDYIKEIPKQYRKDLYDILKKNIVIKEKALRAEVLVESQEPNGLYVIKDLFAEIPKSKEVKVDITYEGGGKYLITAKAKDYKIIEKYLSLLNDYFSKKKKKFVELDYKRVK